MTKLTRRLTISGRVQGVGFRWALRAQASALGLAGWVRNRRDGSVEAVLGGPPAALEALIAWAQRGPPGARVDRVLVNDEPGNEWLDAATGVEQRPTF
jgi:acylphosphatase